MSFSVVIPVYNGERFIRACVESVRAQTHAPLEIIVVNDGSTDGTAKELAALGPGLRVLEQPNRGRSVARNEGMRAARGDYIAFLDADDAFLPDHLAQLASAVGDGEVEIVHDALVHPYLSSRERAALVRRRVADRREDHLTNFFIAIQASAIERSWVAAHDLTFQVGRHVAQDALFFWSAILLGARIRYVPEPGTTYGVHAGNTTRDARWTHRKTIDAYAALEAFIEARGLALSARERTCLDRGKQHAKILASLHALREEREEGEQSEACEENEASPRQALRSLLLSPHVTPVDRVRCLVAQAWPYFPLARHRRLVRGLFGFAALRAEDATDGDRV